MNSIKKIVKVNKIQICDNARIVIFPKRYGIIIWKYSDFVNLYAWGQYSMVFMQLSHRYIFKIS